jgi:hypothetical protein
MILLPEIPRVGFEAKSELRISSALSSVRSGEIGGT